MWLALSYQHGQVLKWSAANIISWGGAQVITEQEGAPLRSVAWATNVGGSHAFFMGMHHADAEYSGLSPEYLCTYQLQNGSSKPAGVGGTAFLCYGLNKDMTALDGIAVSALKTEVMSLSPCNKYLAVVKGGRMHTDDAGRGSGKVFILAANNAPVTGRDHVDKASQWSMSDTSSDHSASVRHWAADGGRTPTTSSEASNFDADSPGHSNIASTANSPGSHNGEHLRNRLEYYSQEGSKITAKVLAKHRAGQRKRKSFEGPSYWSVSAILATGSYSNGIRVKLAHWLVHEGPSAQLLNVAAPEVLMMDFGSFSWTFLEFCLLEKGPKELFRREKAVHGWRRAAFSFVKGLVKVVGFSLLNDVVCYRVLRKLSNRRYLPGHLALAASIWAGNAAVHSIAWRMRGRRGSLRFGETMNLALLAEADAIWSLRRATIWSQFVRFTAYLSVFVTHQVCRAAGSDYWTLRDVGVFLHILPPQSMWLPSCTLPQEVDDAMEEQCHDLKCPITFELLVQPTDFHGKIYERCAAERWIRRNARVPHSPDTPAFKHDLKSCPDMDRLLKAFREEFGVTIDWEAA
ncbi:hypothetical protein WJX73_007494 [Symbiochloris irregularis]|uniref:U-box domain-containing protein n=1 Tax=Symbiochloris irregularis TaxID=706552 RepID=A0AAW1P3E3_9CHLO